MTLLAQLFTTLDLKILLRVFKNMVIQINQILQKQKKKTGNMEYSQVAGGSGVK